MEDDVYKTPSSPLIQTKGPAGSIGKGIICGVLIAVVLKEFADQAYRFIYIEIAQYFGMHVDGLKPGPKDDPFYLQPLLFIVFATRFLLDFMAGFICAKLSSHYIYRSTLVVCFATSIYIWFFSNVSDQITLLASILIHSLLILFGAFVYVRKSS